MIALPRSMARRFRAVLRRCGTGADYRRDPFVVARSGSGVVSLEAVLSETSVRLEHDCPGPEEVIAFTGSLLARIEGNTDDGVILEERKPGFGKASWSESDSPIRVEFGTAQVGNHHFFPDIPSRQVNPGDGFLLALHEASQTSTKQNAGRNLHRLLLRGGKGLVAGTDGRQLFVHEGFRLPWNEDLLVPRIDAWGSRDLPDEEAARVACSDRHVFVRVGPWTFALTVERDGRFPAFENVIPREMDIVTRLKLSPEAVALLGKELPRLAGAGEKPAVITLQLGKQVVIRSQADGKEAGGELIVGGAQSFGPSASIQMDRKYLLQALRLGFREVQVKHPAQPLCCRDGPRTYVWMPLSEPEPSARPTPRPSTPSSVSSDPRKEESSTMPDNNGKQLGNGDSGVSANFDPLSEAESVKALLNEAQSRLARLLAALKQHRRQARAVRAAMQSLRDLPPLAP